MGVEFAYLRARKLKVARHAVSSHRITYGGLAPWGRWRVASPAQSPVGGAKALPASGMWRPGHRGKSSLSVVYIGENSVVL